MKQKYRIRKAKTKEDVLGIIDVQAAVWLCSYEDKKKGLTKDVILEHLEDEYREEKTDEVVAEYLEDENSRTWVAINEDNHVVGYISCKKHPDSETGSFVVYVLPEYQGIGLGRRLMKKGLSWLKDQKYLEIMVFKQNKKALEMYKKMGFEDTGEEKDIDIKNFEGEGTYIVMRKYN